MLFSVLHGMFHVFVTIWSTAIVLAFTCYCILRVSLSPHRAQRLPAPPAVLFQHNFYIGWMDATAPDSEDPGPDDGTDPMWLAKVVVPTFEAAAMFIVLWGMALLPITLCRWLIAQVAKTGAARYLPLTHLVDFHIFVGTSFVFQVRLLIACDAC